MWVVGLKKTKGKYRLHFPDGKNEQARNSLAATRPTLRHIPEDSILQLKQFCKHHELRAEFSTFYSSLSLTTSGGLLARVLSPSQGRYPHRATQTLNADRQLCVEWGVGCELGNLASEQAKTIDALHRAATLIRRLRTSIRNTFR
jgi:hypothetical protein